MAEQTLWEYRVERFGTIFRETKDAELEAALDEWGAEGWEVVSLAVENNRLVILAKRPLSLSTRRRRSMPGYA